MTKYITLIVLTLCGEWTVAGMNRFKEGGSAEQTILLPTGIQLNFAIHWERPRRIAKDLIDFAKRI